MTPGQRFTLLMVLLTAGLAAIGFLIKKLASLNTELVTRNTRIDDTVESLRRHDEANRASLTALGERVLKNYEALAGLYTELNEKSARMDGRIDILIDRSLRKRSGD